MTARNPVSKLRRCRNPECDSPPFRPKRSTKIYCSDRCRKKVERATSWTEEAADLEVRDQLRWRQLIGQVWPVYTSDKSPPVIGLLVPRAIAAAELGIPDEKLANVLRRLKIAESDVEVRLIKEFYETRKDRRVCRLERLSRTESGGQVPK
jgi:hypothetical protein